MAKTPSQLATWLSQLASVLVLIFSKSIYYWRGSLAGARGLPSFPVVDSAAFISTTVVCLEDDEEVCVGNAFFVWTV